MNEKLRPLFSSLSEPTGLEEFPVELNNIWRGGDDLDPDEVLDPDDPDSLPVKGKRGFSARVIVQDEE